MTNHPLTDEMCEDLMQRISKYPYTDDVIEDMRAAADWQLEQVIDWIEQYLTAGEVIAEDLKKAMRPQEEN
jgi:hypothetical protein